MTERILVVHVAAIGDAAVASTVAERLRAERPAAEVTWVCGEVAVPLVRLYEGVSRVIGVDQQTLFHGSIAHRSSLIAHLWRRLAGARFDDIFILHPDRRYRVLVMPLFGTQKHALSRRAHGDMNPIPGRFHGDEYARLVGRVGHDGPIERRYAMANLRARFDDAPRNRQRIILIPGGAKNVLREQALKRWPVASYAALAAELIAKGYDVTLVGGPDDAWVRPSFRGIAVEDRIGRDSLVETMRIMRQSDLVVSHDTGPLHLARLVRTPVVALFGPTVPAEMLSMDESVTVIWGGAELACRPCYDGREFARCSNNICMSRISVDQVLAVIPSVARDISSR